MSVEIDSDGGLERFAEALAKLGARRGRQAQARAVNRTVTTVKGRVVRAVVKQASIPRRIASAQIAARRASTRASATGDVEGVVEGTGAPIPLREFRARQFAYGTRARVWGENRRFPGTFIYAGHHRSGQPVGGGHVFQRETSKSRPIRRQTGPAVPAEMVRDQAAEAFERTVAEMLPKRIEHEVRRLLP